MWEDVECRAVGSGSYVAMMFFRVSMHCEIGWRQSPIHLSVSADQNMEHGKWGRSRVRVGSRVMTSGRREWESES